MIENVITLFCLIVISAALAIYFSLWLIGLVNQLLMLRKLYQRMPQTAEEWEQRREEDWQAEMRWDEYDRMHNG